MADKKPSPETWNDDPEWARAYGLVGEFMCSWAVLEHRLNEAIQKLTGVTLLNGYAVTANMGVRDKIHTVKTLLHLYSGLDEEETAANTKLLEKIAARSADRNLVAHTGFAPHQKGVAFSVIKAKGRFDFPETVWAPADFKRRNTEMALLGSKLKAAVAETAKRRVSYEAAKIRNALAPNPDTAPLNALYPPASPPLPPPGSPEASRGKAPRKRKAPQPKPKG